MHGGLQDTRSRYPTALSLLDDQAALPVQAETLAFQYVVPSKAQETSLHGFPYDQVHLFGTHPDPNFNQSSSLGTGIWRPKYAGLL
jgi:hypothetical protein